MSETLKGIQKKDKEGNVLATFDLELPTLFEELEILPGKEKALQMVRNQMKISARAGEDPRSKGGKKGAMSKGAAKEIREALLAKDVSEEEMLEYIRGKRAGK